MGLLKIAPGNCLFAKLDSNEQRPTTRVATLAFEYLGFATRFVKRIWLAQQMAGWQEEMGRRQPHVFSCQVGVSLADSEGQFGLANQLDQAAAVYAYDDHTGGLVASSLDG